MLWKFVLPLMPTLVEKPPEGDGWIHEVKFDGYRSHGGDINDEAQGGQLGETWEDSEPSLGWTNHIDQRLSMKVASLWFEDGEQDAGEMAEHRTTTEGERKTFPL